MTTLDEGELVQALVELATLLRLFERVLAERGDYARMQRELVATRAIRWDRTGDVIERLEKMTGKRLRR